MNDSNNCTVQITTLIIILGDGDTDDYNGTDDYDEDDYHTVKHKYTYVLPSSSSSPSDVANKK